MNTQTAKRVPTIDSARPSTSSAPLEALVRIAADLTLDVSSETRYARLVSLLRDVFPCDAAALLRYTDGVLVPLAVEGLPADALGQRFRPEEHPRLAAIVAASEPVIFDADDPRPDPYDGLIELGDSTHIDVHSCMGCALRIDRQLVGVLTLDALAPGRFDDIDLQLVQAFASLAAAAMRTAGLIDALEESVERKREVARHLVVEALQREGGEVLGNSPAIQRIQREIDLVAGSELTVLITGETGTGKELVARTLHARSSRSDQPLVHVNCAALPESIAESELFGHVKGAFTGAVSNRIGKFELADNATLFLDEIGELPLSIQAKLLRTLQFGEVQRVGSERTEHVDVRIIAATNRDLESEVDAGRFRADLFHRLSVYPIELPPLRDRGEDVILLAGHLLDRARVQLGAGRMRLAPETRRRLLAYDWPGNVRELDHVVTRAALRASRRTDENEVVLVDIGDLDPVSPGSTGPARRARNTGARRDARAPEQPAGEVDEGAFLESWAPAGTSLQEASDEFQRQLIAQAVEETDGNWSAAARRLGVDRSNFHRLGKRLGLK